MEKCKGGTSREDRDTDLEGVLVVVHLHILLFIIVHIYQIVAFAAGFIVFPLGEQLDGFCWSGRSE